MRELCHIEKGALMSKNGSVAYQVTEALKGVFTPGTSRHQGKASSQAGARIYSIGTMRAYVRACTRFARWGRERHGIRNIRNLTPKMARDYLDELAGKERAGGYLGKVKAAIGKLSEAVHGERWDLGPGWHSDKRPDRTYSEVDAGRIVQDLRERARDPQLGDVADLQRAAGLRRREAVQLRGKDIDPDRCVVSLERGTKGGRRREVRVDPEHRTLLQRLKARADRRPDGHVFAGRGGLAKRLERAVDEACRRLEIQDQGTHGFRGTWANLRYQRYRREGLSDRQARRRIAVELGHGRIEVTYSYVPRGV